MWHTDPSRFCDILGTTLQDTAGPGRPGHQPHYAHTTVSFTAVPERTCSGVCGIKVHKAKHICCPRMFAALLKSALKTLSHPSRKSASPPRVMGKACRTRSQQVGPLTSSGPRTAWS